MFENVFSNIDDVLHKDDGCGTELDYVEQSSWILFLKYLDDLEEEREAAATLSNQTYKPLLEPEYRWRQWAAPKKADGTIDHAVALTGDDLLVFANDKLFPYLAGFRASAENSLTLEYKIGEIFTEVIDTGRAALSKATAMTRLRIAGTWPGSYELDVATSSHDVRQLVATEELEDRDAPMVDRTANDHGAQVGSNTTRTRSGAFAMQPLSARAAATVCAPRTETFRGPGQ